MKRLGLTITMVLIFTASPALADIIIEPGNIGSLDDENVLLGSGTVGTIITGHTNTTDTLVDFTGNEDLTDPPSGQARIEGEDGGLQYLLIQLHNPGTFTSLIFNLNASGDGGVVITANGSELESLPFELDGNGENFFTIHTLYGQVISSVAIASDVDLQDVRQVRIGFEEQIPPPVPEPATTLLLGSGLTALGVALVLRRRRN